MVGAVARGKSQPRQHAWIEDVKVDVDVQWPIWEGIDDATHRELLGHVFVANMTGNVVLLGFALVGAPGFSVAASVVSVASFTVVALVGGRVGVRFAQHRGHLLTTAATVQAAFLASAVILAVLSGSPIPGGYRYALIAVLAIAMGIQNAAARTLAVPDLTTTVLTLTLTGVAADSRTRQDGGAMDSGREVRTGRPNGRPAHQTVV